MEQTQDPIKVQNYCLALATDSKNEAFLPALFKNHPEGSLVSIQGLHENSLGPPPAITKELFVTWFNDPHGLSEFAIILFYDYENYGSYAAHYNKQRLLKSST